MEAAQKVWAPARPPSDRPLLMLAPMEGISDAIVRDLLSSLGGMDLCVTEFIRVAHRPTPKKVLLEACPELRAGGVTPSGVPVMVQLLGGDPELVATTAATAVELGALGIDLNFGCPAKTVNGSDGGAALLRCPSRLTAIISATRAAVPRTVPVSAKIRLGYDRPDTVVELAKAVEAGGAAWLTIHGRTKVQMYAPSADWHRIREAMEAVQTPVVANGDLFTPEALARCQAVTGARAFMFGRGAFRVPNLFRWARGTDPGPFPEVEHARFLIDLAQRIARSGYRDPERTALNRLKGWVRAWADGDPGKVPLFDTIKRCHELPALLAHLSPLAERAA